MAIAIRSRKLNSFLQTTQNKTYFVLIATVLLVVLMVSFAVVPAYLSITNEYSDNKIKQQYIDEQNHYLSTLDDLAEQEIEYSKQIKLLRQFIPEKRNDEFILANMHKIAERNKVSIITISFVSDEEGSGLGAAPVEDQATSDAENPEEVPTEEMTFDGQGVIVSLGLRGELGALQLFLSELEQFPVPINVSSVAYSNKNDKNQDSSSFDMSLQAKYYYWADPNLYIETNE